jgi:hypothetical protein
MGALTYLVRHPGLWIAGATAARHAIGAYRLHRVLRDLDHGTDEAAVPVDDDGPRLLLIVPVLSEQDHVGAALDWFSGLARAVPGVSVVFVTTEREVTERFELARRVARSKGPIRCAEWPQLRECEAVAIEASRVQLPAGRLDDESVLKVLADFPTTADVVTAYLKEQEHDVPVRHLHCLFPGRKAAQVNYAVRSAGDEFDYVAVYDVDSRPDQAMLTATVAYMRSHRTRAGTWPEVLQQSARFETDGIAAHAWERALARGLARHQTLWTLWREIPSFRRYQAATTRPVLGRLARAVARGLAQTVGHGLIVRTDVFKRVGGLPEHTWLDDIAFGYRLTVAGIPVHHVPVLLCAPSPETPAGAIEQAERWSHSYLDFPAAARSARRAGFGTDIEHTVALATAAYRGTTWLASSPATIAATALALAPRTPAPIRALAAAALWLGIGEPARALARHDDPKAGPVQIARDAAELYAAYLVCSAGPTRTAIRALLRRDQIGPFSPKTHHRNGDPT